MKFESTNIHGCYLISNEEKFDTRGSFTKLFNESQFKAHDIQFVFKEQFISVSKKFVLRGMHFQMPPFDQDKLITCLNGSFIDVLIDLRVDSPSFEKIDYFELNKISCKSVFVPKGLAHGFLSLSNDSMMLYNTSSLHNEAYDKGIKWNSFGFNWPCKEPIISMRDNKHPLYEDFKSPFKL